MELFEIRCPFQRLSRNDGKLHLCNAVCVKVSKGSSGEAKCRKCKLKFQFTVDQNAKPTTGVKVQEVLPIKHGIKIKTVT